MRDFKCLLVTGGAGFIGRAFVRRALARPGWAGRVVILDALTYAADPDDLADLITAHPDRCRIVHGDVGDEDLLGRLFADESFDAVAHCAAETHVDRSIADPLPFVRSNVLGTAVLLEATRRAWTVGGLLRDDVRFLHVSTDEVFGSLGPAGKFAPDSPYDPRSPYAASKAGADHLVRAWANTYGLPVIVTSGSNTYGPGQYPEKLVPRLIECALRDEPLPVYGDGLQVRDWLYVDDHADAAWLALTAGRPGRTYLVAGGGERTNLDMVTALCTALAHATGRPAAEFTRLVEHVADRPGHDRRYALDDAATRRELGWAPRIALAEGLSRTVRWHLDRRETASPGAVGGLSG